jgi:hypothetical protein
MRKWYWFLFLLAVGGIARAQQVEPLSIRTVSLPKVYLRQQFGLPLTAQGGIAPLTWEVTDGALPSGVALRRDGVLTGTPTEGGKFRFVATVIDSGKPAFQKSQELVLQVVAPLLLQWSRQMRVTGPRVEGAVTVSNQTERDFDLTVVVLAVNESGRATAIGYQRMTLKKDTDALEIPFGENLPHGAYQINVDAVAEVAETNSIYRARLVRDDLRVQQGP